MTATRRAITGAALTFLVVCTPAGAQTRWSVQARGGAAFATQMIQGDDLGTGLDLEASASYRFLTHLWAYAAWDWIGFGPETSFAGPNVDFEETGWVLGLRFEHPFRGEGGAGPAYWVRAGATYDHIELEDADDTRFADSGHGPGWEVGAGVAFDVGRVRLTPGARFRALSRDVSVPAELANVDLRYVLLEVGVAYPF